MSTPASGGRGTGVGTKAQKRSAGLGSASVGAGGAGAGGDSPFAVREPGAKRSRRDKNRHVELTSSPKHFQDNKEIPPWSMIYCIRNAYVITKKLCTWLQERRVQPPKYRPEYGGLVGFAKTSEVHDMVAQGCREVCEQEGLGFSDMREDFDTRIQHETCFTRYRNQAGEEYVVISMETYYLKGFASLNGANYNPNGDCLEPLNIEALSEAIGIAKKLGYKVTGNYSADGKYRNIEAVETLAEKEEMAAYEKRLGI